MLSICILYSSMKQICDPNMWRKELYSTKVLRGETLKLCCRSVTWWPRTVPWWRGDIVTWWHCDIVTWWLSDMLTWWDGDIVIWRHCEMVTLWHGDPEVWRKEMPSSRWSAGEVSRAFPQKIPPPLLLKLPTMHLRSKTKEPLFQNKDNFKIKLQLLSALV